MQYEHTLVQLSFWVALTAQVTMFLAELRRWGDRCSYKMHSLADRAYITGKVFSALGLLTLPRGVLVGGKCRMAYITIAGGLVVAKPF